MIEYAIITILIVAFGWQTWRKRVWKRRYRTDHPTFWQSCVDATLTDEERDILRKVKDKGHIFIPHRKSHLATEETARRKDVLMGLTSKGRVLISGVFEVSGFGDMGYVFLPLASETKTFKRPANVNMTRTMVFGGQKDDSGSGWVRDLDWPDVIE